MSSKGKPKDENKVLQPVVQSEPRIVGGLTYDAGFTPKPGEYHLVELDANGNEVPNSDFSVHPRTYERAYKDNTKFKVKKNP